MEIRAFAEQVLFGQTLTDKLVAPERVTDLHPGAPVIRPEKPGRPSELVFRGGKLEAGSKAPSLSQLEDERTRGRLLHFFANHELLATELMALVLLKFPDAPKPFRRGVFKTLVDEQGHARLYIDRMRQFGVSFGAYPVSGFFWDLVASMRTPMDYVSRLSLTFEQANLDHSRFFAEGFRKVGDLETAAILDRIHRDEIVHVGYGLKWFRRWKEPGRTDWQAFRRQLVFPLSPSRAKGPHFDPEGRQRAGLDEEFIAEMFVYSKSRGRTPDVYYFNSLAELAIADGGSHTPSRRQSEMTRDLAILPQYLGADDDVILVPDRPRTEFLAGLKRAGFQVAEFVPVSTGTGAGAGNGLRIDPAGDFEVRKVHRLRPWAWSPDAIRVLRPLLARATGPVLPVDGAWDIRIKPLFSKTWSVELLKEWLSSDATGAFAHRICSASEIGVVATSVDDVLGWIDAFRARGHRRLVVKRPFGMAGNRALRLWELAVSERQLQWLANSLRADGEVVVEPWLDRLVDFSFQFEMQGDALRFLGKSKMINDHRGQFQSSRVTPRFTHGLTREIAAWLHLGPRRQPWIKDVQSALTDLLLRRFREAKFEGPIGVDALIYRDAPGSLRLKPIVEINPRFTMGRLTLELMRHASPGRSGTMTVLNRATLRARGFDRFDDYARQVEIRNPTLMDEHPTRPRIRSGTVFLNDPASARACLATFTVDG